jgi:glyoxylase-like metal-dependent hydrolase (beta-lactamase superfamily II)
VSSGAPAERPSEASEQLEERAALALAAAAGIHRVAVPTPFQVGRVNAYLIEDDPLTLIDSGPNSAKALDELEQGLAKLGHRVEDLELLIITHQHMDHFGLAAQLAARSGAEVAALDAVAPYLSHYDDEAEADDLHAIEIMKRHGIPPDITGTLRSVSASFRVWGATVPVTRPLTPGEDLVLRDRTLRVLHRPGHSPSDTVFWDRERELLIAGDHLIAHISSNPLVTRPLQPYPAPDAGLQGPRPQALVAYLESMRQTREMKLDLVLSGHGRPILDHAGLIDERIRQHDRRAQRILRAIVERPRTAHEIAHELWGNVAVTQAYLTLSEVLGHVDLLLNNGDVEEVEDEYGVVRFTAKH